MTPAEIDAFLRSEQTIILTSNGPSGFPHPMPMWYSLDEKGDIQVTTFSKSQKVKNLKRDPRASLLVESGKEYAELKGVLIYARSTIITDPDVVAAVLLKAAGNDAMLEDNREKKELQAALQATARKRVVIQFAAEKTISWDHAKLKGTY